MKYDQPARAGRTPKSAASQLRGPGRGLTGRQNVEPAAKASRSGGGATGRNRPAPGTSLGAPGPTTADTS